MTIKPLWLSASLALLCGVSHATPNEVEVNQTYFQSNHSTHYQPDGSTIEYSTLDGKAVIEGDIVVGEHNTVQQAGVENLTVLKYEDVYDMESNEFTPEAAWSGNTTWQNST